MVECDAWCASSLRAAQLLAEGLICDLKKLRIVSDKAFASERVWIYDYRRLQWVEHPRDSNPRSASHAAFRNPQWRAVQVHGVADP